MVRTATLVVGGTGAIGQACVRDLVAKGRKVVVADVDHAQSQLVATELGAEFGLGVDVTDPDSVKTAVEVVNGMWRLGAAINVAGVPGPSIRLHEYTDEEWHRVLSVNLTGMFNCLRAELSVMRGRPGAIVNISSITGKVGVPSSGAYTASKHGVEGLTKASALDYADDGIRINAVAPGFIETAMLTSQRHPSQISILEHAHPMRRLGQAHEVASVATFLLSDAASFVTGSTYVVDGGYLTR